MIFLEYVGSRACLSAINPENQGLTEFVHENVHELPRD